MRLALAVLVALAAVPLAQAHSGGPMAPGDSPGTAPLVAAPAYLFSDAAGWSGAHYYRIQGAQEVRIRLAAIPGEEPAEVPVVFVFGPTFAEAPPTPADVERPNATGGVAFPASARGTWDVDALGLRTTLLLDRTIALGEGEHLLVVRSTTSAPLLLALGSPRAWWTEPLVVPGLRDEARAWSNAPVWPNLLAGALAGAAVIALARVLRARPWSLHVLAAFASATIVAATGAALATDAARTGAGWTLAIGAMAAALAAIASTRPPRARPAWWQRALLLAAGLAAFALFAGATWGPAAAVAGAILPEPAAKDART